MLYYLSAAYSDVEDKDTLVKDLMQFAIIYMKMNPGIHVVCPLFYHYGLKDAQVPTDYAHWGDYSRDLLRHCQGIIVYQDNQKLWATSKGVQDELALAQTLKLRIVDSYS